MPLVLWKLSTFACCHRCCRHYTCTYLEEPVCPPDDQRFVDMSHNARDPHAHPPYFKQ